jgi:hypothetical protein
MLAFATGTRWLVLTGVVQEMAILRLEAERPGGYTPFAKGSVARWILTNTTGGLPLEGRRRNERT